MELYEKLIHLRKQKGLSQLKLAGKLSFKVTSLGSIMSGKCWLKGTVTGSEDKIDVTWRM